MNDTPNADQQELDKFAQLAHHWWDPNSEFKPLHDINPLRLDYVDQAAGLGHCLEEVRKQEMPVVYLGTGERVPGDLMVPSTSSLMALEDCQPLRA